MPDKPYYFDLITNESGIDYTIVTSSEEQPLGLYPIVDIDAVTLSSTKVALSDIPSGVRIEVGSMLNVEKGKLSCTSSIGSGLILRLDKLLHSSVAASSSSNGSFRNSLFLSIKGGVLRAISDASKKYLRIGVPMRHIRTDKRYASAHCYGHISETIWFNKYKRLRKIGVSDTYADLETKPTFGYVTLTPLSSCEAISLSEVSYLKGKPKAISGTSGTSLRNTLKFVCTKISLSLSGVDTLYRKEEMSRNVVSTADTWSNMDTKEVFSSSLSSLSKISYARIAFLEEMYATSTVAVSNIDLPKFTILCEFISSTTAISESAPAKMPGFTQISSLLNECVSTTYSYLNRNKFFTATLNSLSKVSANFEKFAYLDSRLYALSNVSIARFSEISFVKALVSMRSDTYIHGKWIEYLRRDAICVASGTGSLYTRLYKEKLVSTTTALGESPSRFTDIYKFGNSLGTALSNTKSLIKVVARLRSTAYALSNISIAYIDLARVISASVASEGNVYRAEFWTLPVLKHTIRAVSKTYIHMQIPYSGLVSTSSALGESPSRFADIYKFVVSPIVAIAHSHTINSFRFDVVKAKAISDVYANLSRTIWDEAMGDNLEIEIY